MSEKKDPPFHNPFAAAREKLAGVVKSVPTVGVSAKPKTEVKPGTRTGTNSATETKSGTDAHLFANEMLGVTPLAPDPRGRLLAPEPNAPLRSTSQRARDDAESYAELADLVEGNGRFDIADSDELVEGIAPGLDRRILKRLRKGEYALQGHLDLHGLTRDEARSEVAKFLDAARAQGKRCVLLIHGRGLNSKDQIPVLKERIKIWLERGRIARSVLAFTTARPCDGGAGAVYVLLRR